MKHKTQILEIYLRKKGKYKLTYVLSRIFIIMNKFVISTSSVVNIILIYLELIKIKIKSLYKSKKYYNFQLTLLYPI